MDLLTMHSHPSSKLHERSRGPSISDNELIKRAMPMVCTPHLSRTPLATKHSSERAECR